MLEIIYKDRDNTIDFRLKANTVLDPELKIVDLTNITRMVLSREDGFQIDSEKEPNIFDWSTNATSGIVTIQLGHLNLKEGRDKWRLIVYDASNLKGLVWGKKAFEIDIREKYHAFST